LEQLSIKLALKIRLNFFNGALPVIRSSFLLLLCLLAVACSTQQPNSSLETVAALSVPPGNPTVTSTGRLITSVHPFGDAHHRVIEILPDNTTSPFPNETWSSPPNEDGVGLSAVIGVRADLSDVVWILDMGTERTPPRLIAWSTKENSLEKVIVIPYPASRPQSFLQDFAIDSERGKIYIADSGIRSITGPSEPGIIIVDIQTGLSRRVLHADRILQPEQNASIIIDGKPLSIKANSKHTVEPRIGLNPIALDPNSEWLYFGAMNGSSLYRLKITDLLNQDLYNEQLVQRIEHYGFKPVSDGIAVNARGQVFVTDLNAKAVGVLGQNQEYKTVIKDPLLMWPDGLTYGPDGYMYLSVNQLNVHPLLNNGVNETQLPFRIMRFKNPKN
jgi:sugar lactone lactonase YvrE